MANPIRKVNPRNTDDVFSDLDINMARNPVTGNLAKVTDEEAVKASLRNIVMVMQGEWPHYRLLGSRVRRVLFQPANQVTANILRTSLAEAAAFESRAQIVSITVVPMTNDYGYNITFAFYTLNSTILHTYTTILRRIR